MSLTKRSVKPDDLQRQEVLSQLLEAARVGAISANAPPDQIDDIVQKAYLQLSEQIRKRPDVPIEDYARYVNRVARNLTIDYWRNSAEVSVGEDDLHGIADATVDIERDVISVQLVVLLLEFARDNLSIKHRQALGHLMRSGGTIADLEQYYEAELSERQLKLLKRRIGGLREKVQALAPQLSPYKD